MNESEPLMRCREWVNSVKSSKVSYAMISATETCLLVARQAVFRWHDFYLGSDKELGNLCCNVSERHNKHNLEAQIAMYNNRDGSIRSSDDISVMKMEQRDRVVWI